ncbi:hypothetical protein ASV26_12540 [Klebsiella aerogenes]|nr:hypothetical protein ASV26_12540 [Klebsiella aerogenes]
MSLKPQQQSAVLIAYDGLTEFAIDKHRAFITRCVDEIDGDDAYVLGVVTFIINLVIIMNQSFNALNMGCIWL